MTTSPGLMMLHGLTRRRVRPSRLAAIKAVPWPVVAFMAALLVPDLASIYVGPLRISAYRVVLLAAIVPSFIMLLSGRAGPLRAADSLMLAFNGWVCFAIFFHHGGMRMLEAGGVHVLECGGAYLLGRCFIRDPAVFRAFVRLYLAIVVGLIVLLVPEAITGFNPVRELSFRFFGAARNPDMDRRLGLVRATGPFPHPILSGVFCSVCLGLSWYALAPPARRMRPRHVLRTLAVGVATFTAVSTGPLLSMAAQVGLIGWDWLTRRIAKRWLVLIGLMGVMYVAVDAASNRTPFQILATELALNASTGYGRLIIWERCTALIVESPIVGIGFNTWNPPRWMSESLDNFWLYESLRFGPPAALLLLAAIGSIVYGLLMAPRDVQLRMAWLVPMLGLTAAGFGVHYWSQIFVMFCFLIGAGPCLVDAERPPGGRRHVTRSLRRHRELEHALAARRMSRIGRRRSRRPRRRSVRRRQRLYGWIGGARPH